MTQLHERYTSLGGPQNIDWPSEVVGVYADMTNCPLDLDITLFESRLVYTLRYIRTVTGAKPTYLGQSIYTPNDPSKIDVRWLNLSETILGYTRLTPINNTHWEDADVQLNYDHPYFKQGREKSTFAALGTALHEIVHVYSGGHALSIPESMMNAAESSLNENSQVPYWTDLLYLNYLARNKNSSVPAGINAFPLLHIAEGTPYHWTIHIPAAIWNGNFYSFILKKIDSFTWRMVEVRKWESLNISDLPSYPVIHHTALDNPSGSVYRITMTDLQATDGNSRSLAVLEGDGKDFDLIKLEK